jgi:hypothetical protein
MNHCNPMGAARGARLPAEVFVGRRELELAEVHALTETGVERLRSHRRYGGARLDWDGDSVAVVELSHAMLTGLAGLTPSRRLAARFAVDVLMDLPHEGFVIDAQAIWDWLAAASQPEEWLRLPRR